MQTPSSQFAAPSACTRRAAYGAPDAPVIPRKTFSERPYFGPLEASRNAASLRRFASPSGAKTGIGEPLLTQLGHLRWAIWNATPLCFEPSAVRAGAPRFEEPTPRYVWQVVQPETAKTFAPATASLLPAKPCFFAQPGTAALTSLGSDSRAVAPLYVSTPIESATSTAATIATGRRSSLRSRRRSMNGITSSRIRRIVGMPTVPRMTEFG